MAAQFQATRRDTIADGNGTAERGQLRLAAVSV
jgi:hypothetical protein